MDIQKTRSIIQLNDYLTLEEFDKKMLDEFNGTYKYRVCSVYFIDENKFDFYFIFYIRYSADLDKAYIKMSDDIKEKHLCFTYENIYNLINKQIKTYSLNNDEKEHLSYLIDKYFQEKFFKEKSLYKNIDYNFENKHVLLKIIDDYIKETYTYENMFSNCTSLTSIPQTMLYSTPRNTTNNIYKELFK